MNIKTKRSLSLGLSIINAIGVIGTFIYVAKETPQAKEELNKLSKNSSKKTKVKTFIKNYKKSLLLASATIASGIVSKILSTKVEASLLATTAMLESSLKKYKGKVKKIFGVDADKNILKDIMKDEYNKPSLEAKEGEELYWEEHIGYFYAKPINIRDAYILMNEDFAGANLYNLTNWENDGCVTLGEFLEFCKGRPLSHNLTEAQLNFGWSWDYLKEWWEMTWVHMDISEPDENGARMIYWFEEPIWDPANWYNYKLNNITKEEYLKGYTENDIKINLGNQVYSKE